jgi:hypothetical protein
MKTTENLTQENQTLGPCKYEPPDCNVQPCWVEWGMTTYGELENTVKWALMAFFKVNYYVNLLV